MILNIEQSLCILVSLQRMKPLSQSQHQEIRSLRWVDLLFRDGMKSLKFFSQIVQSPRFFAKSKWTHFGKLADDGVVSNDNCNSACKFQQLVVYQLEAEANDHGINDDEIQR